MFILSSATFYNINENSLNYLADFILFIDWISKKIWRWKIVIYEGIHSWSGKGNSNINQTYVRWNSRISV